VRAAIVDRTAPYDGSHAPWLSVLADVVARP
jgi:hypothetical protein